MYDYDMLVIGSGPSGRRAAVQFAKLGKSVLVVEKGRRVGGVSVHTGTIPSKTLRETVLNLSGWRERGFYGRSYRVKQDIGAVDLISVDDRNTVRDITVAAGDQTHWERIVEALNAVDGARVIDTTDRTFLLHVGGKIEQLNKYPIHTRDDLSMAYTPGVARVCMAIHHDPEKAYTLTVKQNSVAVVTDGTAVLGLGDIGPRAAMPVGTTSCSSSAAEAMTGSPVSRQASTRRAVVFSVSPIRAISFLNEPISPTTTGPQWSAARTSTRWPNSRS